MSNNKPAYREKDAERKAHNDRLTSVLESKDPVVHIQFFKEHRLHSDAVPVCDQ